LVSIYATEGEEIDACLPVSLQLQQFLFELFHRQVRLRLAQFARDQLVVQSLYLRRTLVVRQRTSRRTQRVSIGQRTTATSPLFISRQMLLLLLLLLLLTPYNAYGLSQ